MLRLHRTSRLLATVFLTATATASTALAVEDASNEALAWLSRMQTALRGSDYTGEFSFYRDGELNSLSITHGRVDGELRERLVHLNGPRRVILRNGDQVSCLLSGRPDAESPRTCPGRPVRAAIHSG